MDEFVHRLGRFEALFPLLLNSLLSPAIQTAPSTLLHLIHPTLAAPPPCPNHLTQQQHTPLHLASSHTTLLHTSPHATLPNSKSPLSSPCLTATNTTCLTSPCPPPRPQPPHPPPHCQKAVYFTHPAPPIFTPRHPTPHPPRPAPLTHDTSPTPHPPRPAPRTWLYLAPTIISGET